MLKITIPSVEMYDDERERFYNTPEVELRLEHSLVSIAKWESKWHVPFMTTDQKTPEQTYYYIWCMCLDEVDYEVILRITNEQMQEINNYISDPMTATWINERKGGRNNEVVTAELVYYWMIALNIPIELEKWHFNRLYMLIRVCSIKNAPPKKMSKSEILRNNRNLNAARKAALGTKG